LTFDNLLMPEL